MIVALLDTEAAFRDLVADWDGLWRRAGAPPFQSSAWLLPWWDVFGTGRPLVATLRHGDRLCGLLPMYLLDEDSHRKLLPMGIGTTDHLDALIDAAAPPGAATVLLHAVLTRARADGAASCALPDLLPDAALAHAPCPPGWQEHPMAAAPCPVLTVSDGIPAGMRRNLRQSRHRAERMGGWEAVTVPADEAATAWSTLVNWHRARWTALGHADGVLADPAVTAFHQLAVPRLADAGVLQMQMLSIGGQPAAAYHTLAAPGRLMFYLSGFDAGFAAASPGTLLLGHLLETSTGVREFDFLRGGEAYKYAWGARDRPSLGRLLLPG